MPRACARSMICDRLLLQLVGRQPAQAVVAAERDDQDAHVAVERPVEPRQAAGRRVARHAGVDDLVSRARPRRAAAAAATDTPRSVDRPRPAVRLSPSTTMRGRAATASPAAAGAADCCACGRRRRRSGRSTAGEPATRRRRAERDRGRDRDSPEHRSQNSMLPRCEHAADLLTALAGARGGCQTRSPAAQPAYLDPGPISDRVRAGRRVRSNVAAAAHVAARPVGLERRSPRCSTTIANRLGWLDSPALMADSIDRLRAFADGVKRDGFTDVVLLGMGGSSLAPEVLRAVLGVAPGWPRLHMLDSTDPGRGPRGRHAARARRCICSPASRARRSSRTRWPRISASALERRRHRALGRSLRRDHRRRHRARAARARRAFPRHVHQPVRHRRPLLGAVVLRPGAGGADGTGRRRARRLGRSRCWRRRSPASATRAPIPRSRSAC